MDEPAVRALHRLGTDDDLEDEPCDQCGTRPSTSYGHGCYVCPRCYAAWWCPTCSYGLTPDHVCPTPEEHAARQLESARFMEEIDPLTLTVDQKVALALDRIRALPAEAINRVRNAMPRVARPWEHVPSEKGPGLWMRRGAGIDIYAAPTHYTGDGQWVGVVGDRRERCSDAAAARQWCDLMVPLTQNKVVLQ